MVLQFPSSQYSSLPQLNTLVCLYVILHFLLYSSSSLVHVSSTSTSIISTTSPLITKHGKEALALITWKSSLDIHSQSFLSSWFGASPCNHWFGVTCHKSGSISNLNLHNCGLKGTLHNLNFLAFSDLLALNLRNCETPENPDFLRNGKMVISVKIRNFSRSRMTKRTSPLESSREI